MLFLCAWSSACYSFEPVDPARAMTEIRPHDMIKVVTKTGKQRVFVVAQLEPPDMIHGQAYSVRVHDLVSIEKQDRSDVFDLMSEVADGTLLLTVRLLPTMVPAPIAQGH